MKRWVVTVLFFLLLGALLNVAVAWAIALRVPPQHANSSFKGRAPLIEDDFGCLFGQWEVEVRSEPGWMGIQSMRVRNRVVGANRAAGGVVSDTSSRPDGHVEPRGTRSRTCPAARSARFVARSTSGLDPWPRINFCHSVPSGAAW
jgi:hypothetical protein